MSVQPLLSGLDWPLMSCPCARPPVRDDDSAINFPAISTSLKTFEAKRFGTAAELLCDSILMRIGFDPRPAPEYLPYDRTILMQDGAVIRLQTKARLSASTGGYRFRISRGNPRQGEGVRAYEENAFDLLALVVLEENVIRFSADTNRYQTVAFSEIPGLRRAPGRSFTTALAELAYRSCALTNPQAPLLTAME